MRCPSSVRQEKKGQIPPSSTFGSVQTLSGLDDAPNTPHIISLQPRTGCIFSFHVYTPKKKLVMYHVCSDPSQGNVLFSRGQH